MKTTKLGKWIIGMIAIVPILIVLAGCGGTTSSPGTPPIIDSLQITLKKVAGDEVSFANGNITKTDLLLFLNTVKLYITYTDPDRDTNRVILSVAISRDDTFSLVASTTQTISRDVRGELAALPTGNKTINVVVVDKKGNQSAPKSIAFTIVN